MSLGKYEADLGSKPNKSPKKESKESGDPEDVHKVLGQDIYTDSEDDTPKVSKGNKQLKGSAKRYVFVSLRSYDQ